MMLPKTFATLLLTLAAAACAHGGTVSVAAEKPFHPEGRPLAGLVITLDAGHGGSAHQPGYSGSARGVGSRVVEGDLNMLVAAELKHHLAEAGAIVHMTRRDDRRVTTQGALGRVDELGARTKLAEDTASHLFVSCHHNAAARTTASGVMILIFPKDRAGADQPLERHLAECLRQEVEKQVPTTERFSAWISDHPLVAGHDIPAAAIEFGFLTNAGFDAWVSRRGSHRAEAIGAYRGVERMWREKRGELEAQRLRNFPSAPPPGGRGEGDGDDDHVTTGEEKLLAELAPRVWPAAGGPGTLSTTEAQWLISTYKAKVLTDGTFFHLRARIEPTTAGWALRGATNMPCLAETATELLRRAGSPAVTNEVETLPSSRLGERRFGVCRAPMALTWGEPAEGRDVQTQLLLGEPVMLLDETPDGGYLLLHGGDGYVGWVRSEDIRRMDAAEFARWETTDKATLTSDWMADDFRLPAGASLPIALEPATTAGRLVVRLPSGVRATAGATTVSVPESHLRFRDPATTSPGTLAALAAAEFLTVPYVFGARSRTGLDCSGLTSVAYAAVGLVLPRDARQQVLVGRLVGTPWHLPHMEPGDLVFFRDETGRVMHTGIALGGMRFLHASPPEVQVNSFDPADSLYSAAWRQKLAFVRRPLP